MVGSIKLQNENAATGSLDRAVLAEVEKIDLLFFAYRDFIAEADRVLAHMDYGRAHHRALYFINRKPGMMVAELLDILAITKQSLARVLRSLIKDGYIFQQEGVNDRRQRLLFPTEKGRELLLELSGSQSERISNAVAQMINGIGRSENNNAQLENCVSLFLEAMIDPDNRRHLRELP